MSNGLYNTGISALNAAQYGVMTAGHNIANANTPGFSRQVTEQSPNLAQFTGAGYIGQGVSVATVRRVYNEFLAQQSRQTGSESSSLSTHAAMIARVENMMADPAAGLSPALNAFFKGLHDVAAAPADVAARQSLLASARSLSGRFQSIASQLDGLRSEANRTIESSVSTINAYTRQIAALNDRIVLAASATSAGQPPNDLLDQRDALVADLNKEVRADIVKADDGSYSVFLASGQALVLGNSSFALSTGTDTEDASDTQVSAAVGSSRLRIRPEDLVGGRLGGSVEFRQQSLTDAQNALGRIAMVLASAVNDQHRLGQDLTGALGGTFLSSGSPEVLRASTNAGTGVVSAALASAGSLEASDYRLQYDGTTYTLTRLSDNTARSYASLPQTVDGMTLSLASGTVAAGDRFLIKPVRAGARDFSVSLTDVRAIAAAAPMRTSAGLNNAGTATISEGTVNAPPPPNSNLRQSVTITFTGASTFDVSGTGTGNPTGVAYVSGGTISYNGWSVQITGAPAAGDSFVIASNANGGGDNRNALALASLQTDLLVAGGTATLAGAYGQLVSDAGSTGLELKVSSEAQSSLAAAAAQAQAEVSGVNLDQEASSLIRYQQAYQAAGKMISIASTLFDTILEIRT